MLKSITNSFSNGMNWDTHTDLVKPEQYESALNAVIETTDGDLGGLSNECSNNLCYPFQDDMIVIGSVKVVKNMIDQYVLFLAKPDRSDSAIALFDPASCTFRKVIQNPCFNFDERYPINALAKVKSNDDTIIYFTDNNNKYRSINIDRITTTDYLDPITIISS